MKKILVSATFVMSVGALSLFGESMTGFISDTKCAAAGKANSEAHAKCAQTCIGKGDAPVLVVGDKVYKIADPKSVDGHAGHKVTIDGDVSGDTITVKSVKM